MEQEKPVEFEIDGYALRHAKSPCPIVFSDPEDAWQYLHREFPKGGLLGKKEEWIVYAIYRRPMIALLKRQDEKRICLGCGDMDAVIVSIPNAPGTGDADEGCEKCHGNDFVDSAEEAIRFLIKRCDGLDQMYFGFAGKLLNARRQAEAVGKLVEAARSVLTAWNDPKIEMQSAMEKLCAALVSFDTNKGDPNA